MTIKMNIEIKEYIPAEIIKEKINLQIDKYKSICQEITKAVRESKKECFINSLYNDLEKVYYSIKVLNDLIK